MSKINALREEKATLAKAVRNSLDQNPGKLWTQDHQKAYDENVSAIERIDAEIARHQKADDLAAAASFKAAGGVVVESDDKSLTPKAILNTWMRKGDKGLSAEQALQIRNTMSTTTTTQGGFAVQSDVAKELIDSLKYFGGVRGVATILTTDQGNPLSFPASDGTSEVGELVAENAAAAAADPSFTSVSLNTFKYGSKVVAAPIELLQDATIDMSAFINGRLLQRIGRIQNQHFTTGTGSGQPNGVVTAAASGKVGTTGQTTTVIFDDLVDLIASVDIAYRIPDQSKFMTSDANMAKVRKLKDSQNRPLFIPGWDGLGKAMPDTLLGYPVIINNDIAAMAANAKSILFGNFSKYYIRDALQVSLFRFEDSAYMKNGQVGFLAWMRSGGNLLDSASVKYYQNSAT